MFINNLLGVAPCDPSKRTNITVSINEGLYVNPSFSSAYLSSFVSSGENLFPIKVSVPSVPSKLDILFLVDLSKSITNERLSKLKGDYATTFLEDITYYVPDTQVGVASFTDININNNGGCSNDDYPYLLHLPLTRIMVSTINLLYIFYYVIIVIYVIYVIYNRSI